MHLVKMYLPLLQMPTTFEHTKFLPTTFDKNPVFFCIGLHVIVKDDTSCLELRIAEAGRNCETMMAHLFV